MKNKSLKIAGWIIAIIAWCGLWRLGQYLLDMQYSNVAARQLVDDGAYSLLKLYKPITGIITIVSVLVILYFVFRAIKTWNK